LKLTTDQAMSLKVKFQKKVFTDEGPNSQTEKDILKTFWT